MVDAAVEEDVAVAGVEAEKHPKIKCPNWQHTSFEEISHYSDLFGFLLSKVDNACYVFNPFFCIVNSAAFMKVK